MHSEILIQAFLTRLLPIYHEVVLGAIRHFHFADYPANALVAAIGALLASALLYAFGIWLRRMPERVSTDEQRERIEKMRAIAHEWLPWLLVLAPTPVGGVLVMAAGFFRLPPGRAWLIILATEVLWRAMPYLTSQTYA